MKKFLFPGLAAFIFAVLFLYAEELPDNEIQATLNGYFDNFRVNIIYPTISFSKKISGSASLTGHYLVDCITAASMRSRYVIDGVSSATTSYTVDGVTSASQREGQYPAAIFDEVRHELNTGIFHLIGEGSVSVNALYSTEHDYRSWTLATEMRYPFALKNTTAQIGFVRSWDRIFPDNRNWSRSKNVTTFSAGLTQVLSPVWIMQVNASAILMSGYLSDPYQPVPVFQGDSFTYHETVLPGSRLRKALGMRSNWMWFKNSSIQIGYRYYWDDWDIQSHTANVLVQKYIANRDIRLSIGIRHYIQQHAGFFKTEYQNDNGFLTVDSKLNDLWSNEIEVGADIKGTYFNPGSMLYSEKNDYHASFGFYQRHTPTPDWFSGYKILYAYTISLGVRYHF